jgi:hypothetical protein
MVEQEILAYYERNDERDRLASGGRRIEFLRVWDLLERFLPAPPAIILDVGGGAGRYAICSSTTSDRGWPPTTSPCTGERHPEASNDRPGRGPGNDA